MILYLTKVLGWLLCYNILFSRYCASSNHTPPPLQLRRELEDAQQRLLVRQRNASATERQDGQGDRADVSVW